MKKTFTVGALTGMSALIIAVPALAQLSHAAQTMETTSANSVSSSLFGKQRPPMTVDQVQQMIERDDAFLKNIDALVAIQKTATEKHKAALTAALTLDDDTARQAALETAHQNMKKTMDDAIAANPDLKRMMPFGPGRHGRHPGGHGRGPADLAQKLGMTQDELKAAFAAGKTIEQLAQEKGVTLPAPPLGRPGPMDVDDAPVQTQ